MVSRITVILAFASSSLAWTPFSFLNLILYFLAIITILTSSLLLWYYLPLFYFSLSLLRRNYHPYIPLYHLISFILVLIIIFLESLCSSFPSFIALVLLLLLLPPPRRWHFRLVTHLVCFSRERDAFIPCVFMKLSWGQRAISLARVRLRTHLMHYLCVCVSYLFSSSSSFSCITHNSGSLPSCEDI